MRAKMNKEALIIHIPHGATHIPEKYKSQFLLSETELDRELLKMTDWYTDELFQIPGIRKQINPVSRLVMDPERFRSSNLEEMAKLGMGAAYTRTSDGRTLRNLYDFEIEQILAELYDPYHISFTGAVKHILDSQGCCLIIYAHSFPSHPLPYEIAINETDRNRPDICLGYDPFHIDCSILQLTETFFTRKQLAVARNYPFAGSLVPMEYYRKDERVQSLMIELNRALYLDETTAQRSESFQDVRNMIREYFIELTGSPGTMSP